MLKSRLLAALLSLCSAAIADTVILKGGEKIEGRVLSETETELTLEYNMTPTIKDQRVIAKADIEKIEKASPDIAAWEAIKNFKVGEDSLDPKLAAFWAQSLNTFATTYPQNPNAAAAKAAATALDDERKRVEVGELKLDNKWLSKDEVQKERVQILGQSYFSQMKKLAAAGRLQDAMVAFERLEAQALGSASYPEAVVLARNVLISLKPAAEKSLVALKKKMDTEDKDIAAMPEPQRAMHKTRVKDQRDRNNEFMDSLKAGGTKWLPFTPATDRGLSALISQAGSVQLRLANLSPEKMRESLAEVAKAAEAKNKGDFAAADTAISRASVAWSQNEKIQRLTAELSAAKAAAAEKKAADDKAKAAAELEMRKQAEESAKAKPKLQPAPTPEPVSTQAPPPVEEDEAVEEKSLFAKPGFWVVIVVLGAFAALGMKVLRKFKDPSGNILDQ